MELIQSCSHCPQMQPVESELVDFLLIQTIDSVLYIFSVQLRSKSTLKESSSYIKWADGLKLGFQVQVPTDSLQSSSPVIWPTAEIGSRHIFAGC